MIKRDVCSIVFTKYVIRESVIGIQGKGNLRQLPVVTVSRERSDLQKNQHCQVIVHVHYFSSLILQCNYVLYSHLIMTLYLPLDPSFSNICLSRF